MKWKNQGHEFDCLGAQLQMHSDIYIYTAEPFAQTLAGTLAFLKRKIRFIVPNEQEASEIQIPLSMFWNDPGMPSKSIVLIPIGYTDPEGIRAQFEAHGFEWNVNLFWSPDFISNILPIYALYVSDILYFPSISFLPSTVCNLNCEKCLIFKPYLRNMRHRPLAELEREIDQFFSCIDYIGLLHISGGEPFLYPSLAELLSYIRNKYGDKIGSLTTVTNCTVMPSAQLCAALKENDVCVECDDYTCTLPQLKEGFRLLVEKLNRHGVQTKVLTHDAWFDVFPPKEPYFRLTEKQLENRFDLCAEPFMELRNGRIYSCNYMGYAVLAGICPDCSEDVYQLNGFSKTAEGRKQLLEFRMRFNRRGYVEFCKYCNGLPSINPCTAIPAEQAPGELIWSGYKGEGFS